MARRRNNPNGANQYLPDPRQSLFLGYYLDPKSPTFSNALQSGLKAGFAQEYAENIMSLMPDWLSERIEKYKGSRLLEKAERNLDEILDLPNMVQAMGAFGPLWKGKGADKEPIMVHATSLLKIKNDASQFIAERIGRKRYGEKAIDPTSVVINNIATINIIPIKVEA